MRRFRAHSHTFALAWAMAGGMLVLCTKAAAAQTDTAYFHATLQDWDEVIWLSILDRNGATGGRFSEAGILQRFHADVDAEYELDLITHRFSLSEDYEWYTRRSGIRWSGGSINKRDLAATLSFKTTVDLGEAWGISARFDNAVNAAANRDILRLGLIRRMRSGAYVFGGGHLDRVKTGMDVAFGVGWQNDETTIRRAQVTIAFLDAFNNTFNALDNIVDSTQVYTKQPIALRSSVSAQVSRLVRVEAYATLMRPATIDRYEGINEYQGFRQDEAFGYAGGLVEWTPLRFLRVGGYGTYVRASTDRQALSVEAGLEPFRLIEQTAHVGLFALARFGSKVSAEVWGGRTWRPERRIYASGAPGLDYEDRSLGGRAMLWYTAPFGLVLEGGLAYDYRDVVRGQTVGDAGALGGRHRRGQLGFGWTVSDQFGFRVAHRFDLDGEPFIKEGAVARLYLYW